MKGRYEVKDRQDPRARGMRFTAKDRAVKYQANAVGVAGRWFILDRETKEEVSV